jgi:hypothetical protein
MVSLAKRFKFRKRKSASKSDGFDSRIPFLLIEPEKIDSVKAGGENQDSDKNVDRYYFTPIIFERYQHSKRIRIEKRNNDFLFGVLDNDNNKSNIMEIRGANR